MKPQDKLNRIMAKAEPILKAQMEEANEMLNDMAKKMFEDQAEWLDRVFKDLLPPDLYEAGKKLERTDEIAAYAKKHGIQVVYIPDTLRIRIMLHGKPKYEFVPQLTVDGEKVEITPKSPFMQN